VQAGWLRLDETALDSLMLLGIHDDGRVTWDDGPILDIGIDSHRLTRNPLKAALSAAAGGRGAPRRFPYSPGGHVVELA
jgi:hypothetical protein